MKIAGGLLSQMPILDICLIYLNIKIIIVTRKYNQESVAGSVIQATGMVEFEDGLRTGVLQKDCWCPCSSWATLESDMARPWRLALTQAGVV